MAIQTLTDPTRRPSRRPPQKASQERTEKRLVEGLLARDEAVCEAFAQKHRPTMVRLARSYVGSLAVAEEVAQEAWAAMLAGLERFQGHSTVKTWLFSILIRRARTIGVKESRLQPISQLATAEEDGVDPTERFFHQEGHPDAGAWAVPPMRWSRNPETAALEAERLRWVAEAVDALPEMRRLVITLRDIEGWTTDEVAELVGKTANWVRVTLHRGRFTVRAAVEAKLGRDRSTSR